MLFTPGSLGCCLKQETTGPSFSQILRPINLPSLCHPFKAWDLLKPKQLEGLTQNSLYINSDPTTKDLDTCTPSQPTSFTEKNSIQIHLSTQPLQRRPTDDISGQGKSPETPTAIMKHIPCTQFHVQFKKFSHETKASSPCHHTFSSQSFPHGTFQAES